MSHFFSTIQLANVKLAEQLYTSFLQDPQSVDPSWRYFFEGMAFATDQPTQTGDLKGYLAIEAYRKFGHLKAKTNPLLETPTATCLPLELTEDDLSKIVHSFGLMPDKQVSLQTLLDKLEKIYCRSIGYQFMHCDAKLIEWFKKNLEQHPLTVSAKDQMRIYRHLNQAELMERYLHVKYVGQKRFSLEGAESMIPLIAEIVETSAKHGAEEIVIGMPHRGRINVLANILRKSYQMIFSEFEDYYDPNGGDGDVKYHRGYSSTFQTEGGHTLHVSLTANPSHLESVVPIVQGRAYAKQMRRQDSDKTKVIPLILHGEASIAGQGVVYETLQLSQLKGYSTGGTIHLIVDNQVGFTTTAEEYRSTHYSTDIALAFGSPVFHVNGEDPEACIEVAQLAVQIRQQFHCDVFINLICYRKHGHNETDEPSFTQPQLYANIRQRPSIRALFHEHLLKQGGIDQAAVERIEKEFQDHLDDQLQQIKQSQTPSLQSTFEGIWQPYCHVNQEELFTPITTAVQEQVLRYIAQKLVELPVDFHVHPKLKRLLEERTQRLDGDIDWALAEHLSFGSLLYEKISIRLSGQDSIRGTFTQRHSAFVDQENGQRYFPLCHLKEDQGEFVVHNSPLSEFGVLSFEYGYSLASPDWLVLWEAQFGDFANGAQVLIDQYLVSSQQRWQRYSGLVLLLPHGYEGQGAEHSSARLERYLQLCAQNNIQICYPTTPAQYFHLLRRQMHRNIRLPLIILTPKGLLRHPACISRLHDFTSGGFQEILFEEQPQATKLLCCSGRIYYDLMEERQRRGKNEIAIVRFEQLYPLRQEQLQTIFAYYTSVEHVFWVQEEPANQGAARMMAPILQAVIDTPVGVIARMARAAAATGSHAMHVKEYEALMDRVFSDETAN